MKRLISVVAVLVGFCVLQGCSSSAYQKYALPEHPAMRASENVWLPHIFGDHMVLQAGKQVPVWGTAARDERVTVTFAGQSVATRASADGRWQVALSGLEDSAEPHDFTVTGDHGDMQAFHDVLVGEVWLGSGQSNMEFPMRREERAKEFTDAANDPNIHLFTVHRHPSDEPVNDVDGKWVVCTPKTVGDFSAVLYHFGLNLHKSLHVPMGLIHSSWGGTPIQAWTPRDGFTEQQITEMNEKLATTRPRFPSQPSVLYNGMIAPIAGYAMRGAIWYQGEADNSPGGAPIYGQRMKTMIDLWRSAWSEGNFPFYFVQIAPYTYGTPETLPILWQQQIWVTKNVPNTGMASTTDIGTPKNIHPTNKHEVGRRLALIALAHTYGQTKVAHHGPTYEDSRVEGDKIRVTFEHTYGGLKTNNGQAPNWFEIAGADGTFVPAQARIEENTVIVWSDKIEDPKYVRLGWNQIAELNLVNNAGLPAWPFTTMEK